MRYIKDYLIAFAFISFTVRLVAVGANYGDAIAIIALAALKGFELWMEHVKIKHVETSTKAELIAQMSALRVELKQEIQENKDKVAALQVGAFMTRK